MRPPYKSLVQINSCHGVACLNLKEDQVDMMTLSRVMGLRAKGEFRCPLGMKAVSPLVSVVGHAETFSHLLIKVTR